MINKYSLSGHTVQNRPIEKFHYAMLLIDTDPYDIVYQCY